MTAAPDKALLLFCVCKDKNPLLLLHCKKYGPRRFCTQKANILVELYFSLSFHNMRPRFPLWFRYTQFAVGKFHFNALTKLTALIALKLHSILLQPCLSGYVFDPPNLKTDDLTFLKEFTDGLAVFLTPDDRKETVDWIFQLDGKIILVIFLLWSIALKSILFKWPLMWSFGVSGTKIHSQKKRPEFVYWLQCCRWVVSCLH